MSDSSGSSIEFVPQHQNASHQRTSTAAWHARLLDRSASSTSGGMAHPEIHDVGAQQAAAPRARRASDAPPVQHRPRRNSNDGSSLVFELEASSGFGGMAGHTVGESSIEFDTVLSPGTQDGMGLRGLAASSGVPARQSAGRSGGNVAKRKQHNDPRSPSRAQPALLGSDPLERLYHVGLDRKLARQQWACMERAKRRTQEEDLDSCTFHPQLSPMAMSIRRPRSLSPQHRANDEVRRKIVWRASQKREAMERELSKCTFKPLTLSAAKLHASAIVHRADLHDKLHDDDAKRRAFRDKVQLQAVKALEEKMLYKRDVPQRAKRSGSSDADEYHDGTTLLTAEDVNAIVERLLHMSIHHATDDPRARGETFHPTINPTSAKIAQEVAARGRSTSPGERQSRHATVASDGREARIGAVRSNLAFERRKHHALLVFNVLAEYVFEQQRRKNTPKGEGIPPPLPIGEDVLQLCELPIDALLSASANLFPVGTATGDDVVRALTMCTKQQLKRISRETFSTSLLNFTAFTSVDATGRRGSSRHHMAAAQEANEPRNLPHPQDGPNNGHDGETAQADADERHRKVVARLLDRQRRSDARIQQERQQRLEEEESALRRATTFKPQINRRSSNGGGPKAAVSALSKATVGQDDVVTEELWERAQRGDAGRRRSSHVGGGGVAEMPHHVPLREEVELTAQPTPAVAATTPVATGGSNNSHYHQTYNKRLSVVESTTRHDCVSRDVISEHAAFGPPKALKEFGTRMMKKQLGQHGS